MDDEILIELKLDTKEAEKAADTIGRKLQKSLNTALGGGSTGGASGTTRAIKDQETAALRLAQAQARLATASGDLGKAQTILSTALGKTTKETTTQIGAQTQLVQVQNRASRSTRELADSFSRLGSRLTLGVSAPLLALGAAAAKTATDFDSLKRGLVSVSGSSTEAEKQLVRLKEVAKLPGLGFKEAIQGSINLQAAGLSAERAEKALRVFGNALATVGKGKAELDGVILALSQIESKGKVSAEEINQLAERVPQIRKAMIAAFGTADTEVIQKAKITSGKFIDAVVTELDKLPKVTGGARNTFENLKDSIEQSLLPLGNKLLSTILPAIEKLTPKVLGLLEAFGRLSPEVQTTAIAFGAAAFAAGPLIGALGNILFLITQIRNIGGISGVLGLGGLGGIAGAAGGAAALGVGLSAIELQQRIRAGDAAFAARGGRLDLEGNPVFGTPENLGGIGAIPGLRVEGGKLVVDAASKTKAGPAIDAVALARANAKAKGASASAKRAADDARRIRLEQSRLSRAALTLDFEGEEARTKQLREGRKTRAELTVEFERTERESQLAQGRLTRAGLTEDFERRADLIEQQAEAQKKFNEQLREAAERARELDPAFRFMRGLKGETDAVASSFDRLGQSIGDSFGDLRNLLSSLGNAIKQFFGDILSATLRSAAASALAPIFGGIGGAVGGGNIFRAPSTFPSGLAFAGDGGLTAPPSISATQGILGSIFGGGSGPATRPRRVTGGAASGAGLFSGFSINSLSKSLGAAAPFLGLSFGASAGGQSRLGGILGAAGGAIAGTAVAASLGLVTAAPILAALPFAAPFALPLIVGAVLLGKAAQRKKDEEASGQFLTQALQGIEQMAQAAASGQFRNIGEARSLFESQIIGTFQQQINTLKTKSVRESRLTNQVRDLRNVFESRIPPIISQQEQRAATLASGAAIDRRLIPEFAIGGTTRGGLAFLHDGEKVLNMAQQRRVIEQSNPSVFERAGVPGVKNPPVFDTGGTFGGGSLSQPMNIIFDAVVVISEKTATGIYVVGARSDTGRAITVNNVKTAQTNREL